MSAPRHGLAGRVLAPALVAALAAGLVAFAVGNLPYTGFWYDEGVQLWVSRGVDPFVPPHTPAAGVLGVIRANGRANLDPGGFSVLLNLWLRWRQDPVWLRTLPLLFFVAGLAAMAWLGWRWRRSLVFAALAAAVPLAYPRLLDHATEARAYSMEFAGVVLGCLVLDLVPAGAGPRHALVAGTVLAAFMGSRYSYTIVAGAVCLVLASRLGRSPAAAGCRRGPRLLALAAPVGAAAVLVLLGLWLQRERLTHQHGALIEYLRPATAAGRTAGELAWAVGANLLSPVALPLTVAALVALIPARRPLGLGAGASSRGLCAVALATLALSGLLWRWHPWDVAQKWSLYLHALSAVVLVRLAADVVDRLETRGLVTPARRVAGVVAASAVVLVLTAVLARHRREHPSDVTAALRHLDAAAPLEPGSVAVTPHAYPVLRYLHEHGPWASRAHYPGAFRLPYHGGPQPLLAPGTRLLVAVGPPALVARRYPDTRIEADPGMPRNLYRVLPAPTR